MITVIDNGGLRWTERPDGHYCWSGNTSCEHDCGRPHSGRIHQGPNLARLNAKYGPLTIVEVV